ncbi:hypothetical protein [uncultured Arcobacter sp.]|uniref:hypothetical protein n=1 Tax=uncultured Arcobacter sp. TaxID=165434 RepID=UPI0026148CEC|nr:hypothetical protein [uncultured Arcobacter sp.]
MKCEDILKHGVLIEVGGINGLLRIDEDGDLITDAGGQYICEGRYFNDNLIDKQYNHTIMKVFLPEYSFVNGKVERSLKLIWERGKGVIPECIVEDKVEDNYNLLAIKRYNYEYDKECSECGMNHTYIKERGITMVLFEKDNIPYIGWSRCAPDDDFSKKKSIQFAKERAVEVKTVYSFMGEAIEFEGIESISSFINIDDDKQKYRVNECLTDFCKQEYVRTPIRKLTKDK